MLWLSLIRVTGVVYFELTRSRGVGHFHAQLGRLDDQLVPRLVIKTLVHVCACVCVFGWDGIGPKEA